MNADELLDHLHRQDAAIGALIQQLDEIQVAFNAQFDQFKAKHDALLVRLSEQLAVALDTLPVDLRSAIGHRLPEERKKAAQRRDQVREKWLPERQRAADTLLEQAQAELAALHALNPRLDEQEESLKAQKAALEARLAQLNDQIRGYSRGLGVVTRFFAIVKADRERQRTLGQLDMINSSLLHVRREWEMKQKEVTEKQTELQAKWQRESIAVARLQAELDQLEDPGRAEALALRRAIYQVLDALTGPISSPDPTIDAALQEMVALNMQTDAYHEGLASVAGFIALLRGISSGLGALRESVQGLKREQEMHSAYLKPLSFRLPASVDDFHSQWEALDRQFSDETVIGQHPAQFAADVKPLFAGPLSERRIESMFQEMGSMLQEATRRW